MRAEIMAEQLCARARACVCEALLVQIGRRERRKAPSHYGNDSKFLPPPPFFLLLLLTNYRK